MKQETTNQVVLDTARRVATPEGVEITLKVAGPVARALAYTLDLLLRGAFMFVLILTVSSLGNFGSALTLLTAFLLEWLYPVFFEVLWSGATPGKKLMGLTVLNDDGTPVRWPASLTRNLLRAIDFLPFMYFTGFCAMVINGDFKRLGDLAANTLVVYRDEKPTTARIPEATPIAPSFPLTLAEQRTLLDFSERASRLTSERAIELADIVAPLTDERNGERALQHILGIANHLVGRK